MQRYVTSTAVGYTVIHRCVHAGAVSPGILRSPTVLHLQSRDYNRVIQRILGSKNGLNVSNLAFTRSSLLLFNELKTLITDSYYAYFYRDTSIIKTRE